MGKVTHVNQTIYREQSTKQPIPGKVVRKKYLFELAKGLYRETTNTEVQAND